MNKIFVWIVSRSCHALFSNKKCPITEVEFVVNVGVLLLLLFNCLLVLCVLTVYGVFYHRQRSCAAVTECGSYSWNGFTVERFSAQSSKPKPTVHRCVLVLSRCLCMCACMCAEIKCVFLLTGILQLLTSRTSRKFLACRLTPDMETKLLFMTSRVTAHK